MALHPCSFGHHRFRGRAATVYPAISDGATMTRWKFWACPEHATIVDEALTPYEVVDGVTLRDAASNADHCLTCGAFTDDDQRRFIYVTAYFQGQDRRDFWSALHLGCSRPGFLPDNESE